MKTSLKERLFTWAAIPTLTAVLITLAVLQYRWSGQVSTANKAQMQAQLQTALFGFRNDLTHELSAVALEVRAAMDESANDPQKFAQKLRHWQQTAAHPGLVSGVYLWDVDLQHQDQSRLLFINTQKELAESIAWPQILEPIRQHFAAMHFVGDHDRGGPGNLQPDRRRAMRHMAQHRMAERHMAAHGGDAFLPWGVDQNIPALLYPIFQGDGIPGTRAKLIIVQLNPGALEKEVFPELAQKYFHASGTQEYNVKVLIPNADKSQVLFSSGKKADNIESSTPDGTLNLFGPPFRRGNPGMGGPPPDALSMLGMGGGPGGRPPQADNRGAQAGNSPGGNGAFERQVRFAPMNFSSDQAGWQLVVKHQSGSLESAVSSLRTRNLIVSFSVLILLGMTMTLIVVGAQRARKLARMQMDFVTGVSHEVRTPLAAITSAAENISHGVVTDPQQVVRYGNSILRQSRQLTTLMEQVLLFATTQQKNRHYELRPVDISEVMEAALEGTTAIINRAGFTVEKQIEAHLPVIDADFGALTQCLQNLIVNAVKYGGEARWLRVRAAARRENGTITDITFSVDDHGIGISKAEIKHIFEPFYRSPAVRDSQIHGTGLGLPLAQSIIESMGGQLTAESELGKGSSFTIRFPVMEGLNTREAKLRSDLPASEFPS
jgi:two-component system, OmpR family, sensor histidine kinase SenX3